MGHIRVHGSLANAGDAPAFNLKLTKPSSAYISTPIKAVTARAQVHEWMAVMMPGDKVDFTATIAPADWDTSVLEIDWVTSPTRLKKHLQWTLNLAQSVADPRSTPQPDPSV